MNNTPEIKYDIPFEVTKKQFDNIIKNCGDIVVGRYDDEEQKYYIKVWRMSYVKMVKKYLGA